jgi:hypothetical protein
MLKIIKRLDTIVGEDPTIIEQLNHFYDTETIINMDPDFKERFRDKKVDPHETLTSLRNSISTMAKIIPSIANRDLTMANNFVSMVIECMKRVDKICEYFDEKYNDDKHLLRYLRQNIYYTPEEIKSVMTILPRMMAQFEQYNKQMEDCSKPKEPIQ